MSDLSKDWQQTNIRLFLHFKKKTFKVFILCDFFLFARASCIMQHVPTNGPFSLESFSAFYHHIPTLAAFVSSFFNSLFAVIFKSLMLKNIHFFCLFSVHIIWQTSELNPILNSFEMYLVAEFLRPSASVLMIYFYLDDWSRCSAIFVLTERLFQQQRQRFVSLRHWSSTPSQAKRPKGLSSLRDELAAFTPNLWQQPVTWQEYI